MPPHLTRLTFKRALSPPSSLTHWASTTRGGVENLPTSEIRQGNLELTALPRSLDNTRNTKMLPCPHPTSTLLWATPRTKWCHFSQPWGYNNTVFGQLYRPNRINKSLCPIDTEHKFDQERVPAWFSVGIELWSLSYKRAILTSAPYWPGI